jgi:hypothetical protein
MMEKHAFLKSPRLRLAARGRGKGKIMRVIYSEHLTSAERKAIEERYAPYHRFEEFWTGYYAYQNETGRYTSPASLRR